MLCLLKIFRLGDEKIFKLAFVTLITNHRFVKEKACTAPSLRLNLCNFLNFFHLFAGRE